MLYFENAIKAERQLDMLADEAKTNENKSLKDMPMDSQVQPEEEEPTEVVLAMLFTAAKILEKRHLAHILTGQSPTNKKPITYIRLPMVEVDDLLGFRLIESLGNPNEK